MRFAFEACSLYTSKSCYIKSLTVPVALALREPCREAKPRSEGGSREREAPFSGVDMSLRIPPDFGLKMTTGTTSSLKSQSRSARCTSHRGRARRWLRNGQPVRPDCFRLTIRASIIHLDLALKMAIYSPPT